MLILVIVKHCQNSSLLRSYYEFQPLNTKFIVSDPTTEVSVMSFVCKIGPCLVAFVQKCPNGMTGTVQMGVDAQLA